MGTGIVWVRLYESTWWFNGVKNLDTGVEMATNRCVGEMLYAQTRDGRDMTEVPETAP